MLFQVASLLTTFGKSPSNGNIAIMQGVLDAVTESFTYAYGGNLDRHQRTDTFSVNSRRRAFSQDLLSLQLYVPFVTMDTNFAVSHESNCCNGYGVDNITHGCFCFCSDTTDESNSHLDPELGRVLIECPCDLMKYTVTYTAGFEVDGTTGLHILPAPARSMVLCMIRDEYNQQCPADDTGCSCKAASTSVMIPARTRLFYRGHGIDYQPLRSIAA